MKSAGWLRLAPWRRAPLLSLGQPAVIVAVVVAAAILACAGSSAALFLSSASSESLRVQLAAECPDAAFPVLAQSGFGPGGGGQSDVSELAPQAITSVGLADPYRVVRTDGSVAFDTPGGATALGQVFYRDGAAGEVSLVSSAPGEGVLLPASMAERLAVGAGDEVRLGAASVAVVGVYRDLFTETPVRAYWCSYADLFLNESSVEAPPPLVIATSPDIVGVAGQVSPYGVLRRWVSPIETSHLTLSAAKRIVGQEVRAFELSQIRNQLSGTVETGMLPEMVARTELITDGLRGPVVPIAIGGSLLALLLVGSAGSYWVDRRIREVRLLSSRGVGPLALAVKACLELAIPAVLGTAGGWLLARVLVARLGPSPDVDSTAPWQAGLTAAVGLVVGLLLLGLIAGTRSRAMAETPIGSQRSWLLQAPWELLLMAGSLAIWLALRSGGGVVIEQNVAQLKFLLVSFPMLFLLGAAVLVARLLALLVPALRRGARSRSPGWFLAINRATASRLVSAGVLVTVSLPVAVLVYSSALTSTSQTTLEAKAGVVVGSDVALIATDRLARTPGTDAVGTIVDRYPSASVQGRDVTVLAVDPDTFARWAYWDPRFAAAPLQDLLDQLRTAHGGPVRAVAIGLPAGVTTVDFGDQDVPVEVVATAATFPGRRLPDPIVVVDAAALGDIDRSHAQVSEIWSTRSEAAVRAALPAGTLIQRVQDRSTVFRVANFLSVAWTFDYLRALAALVGIVAVGGLLLYVETRQRGRVASYALARRMGLAKRAHLGSLFAELGSLLGIALLVGLTLGWVAVLTVYGSIELDPSRPPPPLLTAPVGTIAIAAAATLLIAGLTAGYAQRAADRANIAIVLRLGS